MKHRGQFKITTAIGKTIGYACSKEEANQMVIAGRSRRALPWVNALKRYGNKQVGEHV